MNKISVEYESLNQLRIFIIEKGLCDYDKVIIKMYSPFDNSLNFLEIKNAVLHLAPKAKFVVIVNDDNWYYEEIDTKKVLVVVSMYGDTTAEMALYNKQLREINVTSDMNIREGFNRRILDDLVGTYNRYKLVTDIKESKFNKIALFDLAKFKKINSFYGNDIGDEVLIKVGKYLKDGTEDANVRVYRVNADVFAIVGHISISVQEFIALAKLLQAKLKRTCFLVQEQEIFLSATLAVAYDLDNLIEKADLALEYAKREKREYNEFARDIDLVLETQNNLIWTEILRKAIADDRVLPYYQGIFNNTTNVIDKYESLMRIIDEEGNVISPYYFLEIARQSGLYKQMMKIIIDKTFDTFSENDYLFSLNLSFTDMVDGEIKDLIMNKLQNKIFKGRVIFEILETEGVRDYTYLADFIEEVKKNGAMVAIDDFGTGYSNYEHLIKLKPDIIKIDGSIIKNIDIDDKSSAVTESILHFAKRFGCITIAEFVSDKSIHEHVKKLGIDYSQGYFFSIPSEKPLEI